MLLVKHYQPGTTPEVVHTLTEEEKMVLFSGGSAQQEMMQQFRGHWLVCDCNVPSTIKRMTESNHHFLARIKGRDEHEVSCPLFSIIDKHYNPNQAIAKPLGTSYSFSVDVPDSQNVKSIIATETQGATSGRTDKLYSLIASVLSDSGMQRLKYGSTPSLQNNQERILDAAVRYSLGGRSLSQYLYFSFDDLDQIKADLAKRAQLFTGRNRPQAIILSHVEGMIRHPEHWAIKLEEHRYLPLSKLCKVTRLNGMFNYNKGPVLVTAVVAQVGVKEDRPVYGIVRAFFGPAVNKVGYMLVDSDLERTFAKVVIRKLIESQSAVTVDKPLIARYVDDIPVLPDFIVQQKRNQTAVEVMGKWDDEEYQERKLRTVPAMQTLYDAVVDVGKTTSGDREAFYTEINDCLDKLLMENRSE